jgi:hypothetical protein
MKSKVIEIKHQEEKTIFKFEVENPKKLTREEVEMICEKMDVKALFMEGKYYSL